MSLTLKHVFIFALVFCAFYYLMGDCGCNLTEGINFFQKCPDPPSLEENRGWGLQSYNNKCPSMDVEREVISENSGMVRESITEEMAQAKCEQFYTSAIRNIGHRKCDGKVSKKNTWPIFGAKELPYWQCNPKSMCSVN